MLISIKISLKFVPKGLINNIPAFVQIMAWRRLGDKPLSEPMMIWLPTHICVTRPQWVNWSNVDIRSIMPYGIFYKIRTKFSFICFADILTHHSMAALIKLFRPLPNQTSDCGDPAVLSPRFTCPKCIIICVSEFPPDPPDRWHSSSNCS